ncbi:hypothetical protein IMZ48_43220 [Candidatus Bathyarchaeota archaeon]|nr:hypothetical protein [Candidatus Bathyarchaeota archaeon]
MTPRTRPSGTQVRHPHLHPQFHISETPELTRSPPLVPDFYGEKISSVKGYRQWLKDQRAYNKKREVFV